MTEIFGIVRSREPERMLSAGKITSQTVTGPEHHFAGKQVHTYNSCPVRMIPQTTARPSMESEFRPLKSSHDEMID